MRRQKGQSDSRGVMGRCARGALTCTCRFPARQCGQTVTQSQTPVFSDFSKPGGGISSRIWGMRKAFLLMAFYHTL